MKMLRRHLRLGLRERSPRQRQRQQCRQQKVAETVQEDGQQGVMDGNTHAIETERQHAIEHSGSAGHEGGYGQHDRDGEGDDHDARGDIVADGQEPQVEHPDHEQPVEEDPRRRDDHRRGSGREQLHAVGQVVDRRTGAVGQVTVVAGQSEQPVGAGAHPVDHPIADPAVVDHGQAHQDHQPQTAGQGPGGGQSNPADVVAQQQIGHPVDDEHHQHQVGDQRLRERDGDGAAREHSLASKEHQTQREAGQTSARKHIVGRVGDEGDAYGLAQRDDGAGRARDAVIGEGHRQVARERGQNRQHQFGRLDGGHSHQQLLAAGVHQQRRVDGDQQDADDRQTATQPARQSSSFGFSLAALRRVGHGAILGRERPLCHPGPSRGDHEKRPAAHRRPALERVFAARVVLRWR
jgi:hypothetical protein